MLKNVKQNKADFVEIFTALKIPIKIINYTRTTHNYIRTTQKNEIRGNAWKKYCLLLVVNNFNVIKSGVCTTKCRNG